MNYLVYVDRLLHKQYGIRVYVSLKSSWRPKWWEYLKKRSGNSQHTYQKMGGTDITCDHFAENWMILLDHLIKHTGYTRLAVYHNINPKTGEKSGFIHGDFKNEYKDSWVYKIVGGIWKRDYKIER